MSKINTYIGLSARAGDIVYGINSILETKKSVKLIIIDSSLTDNGLSKTISLCEYKKCMLIKLKEQLLIDILKRDNIKVVGLTNKNLVKAVLSLVDEFDIIHN